MYVLHVAGFHVDATSRSRHDRARFVLAAAGIAYTECTVNRAGVSFPDAELPQLCVQEPNGNLRVVGGMDAIDRLNDEGRLRDCRAECEEFKAAKRREYEARQQRAPKDSGTGASGPSAVNGAVNGADRREERREERDESDPEREEDRCAGMTGMTGTTGMTGMTGMTVKNVAHKESVEAMRAELAAARRTAAEAVRSAEQANAELEAMERNAARLEKKLAVVSRALESAVALVGTLLPLGAD
jgi:hypothetical protein